MRAIIIEDEINVKEQLKNLIHKYTPEVEIIGDADGVESGLKLIESLTEPVDVAFCDINLSDGLIFQLLNQLNENINFEIIFVTGHKEFAIKACQYSSIGYLLKPVDPDELVAAVSRVRSLHGSKINQRLDVFQKHLSNPNHYGKISIASVEELNFVHIKDIVRVEGDDSYSLVFLQTGEKIVVSKTIKSYEELLENKNFYRVHKKHLINITYLHKYMKGDGVAIMEDGSKIEVARRRRQDFLEFMRNVHVDISEF
jgi:two-component system, LytTR family, response regulator